jgi:thiamine-phosphate diphosphorylase
VPRLHVVTDDETLARPDFAARAATVLRAGGAAVALHLRGPRSPGRLLYDLAASLAVDAASAGSTLLVNDRVDVALALPAPGVQLGRRSLPADRVRPLVGPKALVGVSVHAPDAAVAARTQGASFVLAGHVFRTPSHPGQAGRGLDWLASVVDAASPLPVVAIGGIGVREVSSVRAAGASGVAALGGIWDAPDPADAVAGYIEALNA